MLLCPGLGLSASKKGKSAQLCGKGTWRSAQSSLCFHCSGNIEFAPSRKGTKLPLKYKGTRWEMCGEKNKIFLTRITIRLGSDQGQRSKICQESHILGVWEKVTWLQKKALRSFILCKIVKTTFPRALFVELYNRSVPILHGLSERPWTSI